MATSNPKQLTQLALDNPTEFVDHNTGAGSSTEATGNTGVFGSAKHFVNQALGSSGGAEDDTPKNLQSGITNDPSSSAEVPEEGYASKASKGVSNMFSKVTGANSEISGHYKKVADVDNNVNATEGNVIEPNDNRNVKYTSMVDSVLNSEDKLKLELEQRRFSKHKGISGKHSGSATGGVQTDPLAGSKDPAVIHSAAGSTNAGNTSSKIPAALQPVGAHNAMSDSNSTPAASGARVENVNESALPVKHLDDRYDNSAEEESYGADKNTAKTAAGGGIIGGLIGAVTGRSSSSATGSPSSTTATAAAGSGAGRNEMKRETSGAMSKSSSSSSSDVEEGEDLRTPHNTRKSFSKQESYNADDAGQHHATNDYSAGQQQATNDYEHGTNQAATTAGTVAGGGIIGGIISAVTGGSGSIRNSSNAATEEGFSNSANKTVNDGEFVDKSGNSSGINHSSITTDNTNQSVGVPGSFPQSNKKSSLDPQHNDMNPGHHKESINTIGASGAGAGVGAGIGYGAGHHGSNTRDESTTTTSKPNQQGQLYSDSGYTQRDPATSSKSGYQHQGYSETGDGDDQYYDASQHSGKNTAAEVAGGGVIGGLLAKVVGGHGSNTTPTKNASERADPESIDVCGNKQRSAGYSAPDNDQLRSDASVATVKNSPGVTGQGYYPDSSVGAGPTAATAGTGSIAAAGINHHQREKVNSTNYQYDHRATGDYPISHNTTSKAGAGAGGLSAGEQIKSEKPQQDDQIHQLDYEIAAVEAKIKKIETEVDQLRTGAENKITGREHEYAGANHAGGAALINERQEIDSTDTKTYGRSEKELSNIRSKQANASKRLEELELERQHVAHRAEKISSRLQNIEQSIGSQTQDIQQLSQHNHGIYEESGSSRGLKNGPVSSEHVTGKKQLEIELLEDRMARLRLQTESLDKKINASSGQHSSSGVGKTEQGYNDQSLAGSNTARGTGAAGVGAVGGATAAGVAGAHHSKHGGQQTPSSNYESIKAGHGSTSQGYSQQPHQSHKGTTSNSGTGAPAASAAAIAAATTAAGGSHSKEHNISSSVPHSTEASNKHRSTYENENSVYPEHQTSHKGTKSPNERLVTGSGVTNPDLRQPYGTVQDSDEFAGNTSRSGANSGYEEPCDRSGLGGYSSNQTASSGYNEPSHRSGLGTAAAVGGAGAGAGAGAFTLDDKSSYQQQQGYQGANDNYGSSTSEAQGKKQGVLGNKTLDPQQSGSKVQRLVEKIPGMNKKQAAAVGASVTAGTYAATSVMGGESRGTAETQGKQAGLQQQQQQEQQGSKGSNFDKDKFGNYAGDGLNKAGVDEKYSGVGGTALGVGAGYAADKYSKGKNADTGKQFDSTTSATGGHSTGPAGAPRDATYVTGGDLDYDGQHQYGAASGGTSTGPAGAPSDPSFSTGEGYDQSKTAATDSANNRSARSAAGGASGPMAGALAGASLSGGQHHRAGPAGAPYDSEYNEHDFANSKTSGHQTQNGPAGAPQDSNYTTGGGKYGHDSSAATNSGQNVGKHQASKYPYDSESKHTGALGAGAVGGATAATAAGTSGSTGSPGSTGVTAARTASLNSTGSDKSGGSSLKSKMKSVFKKNKKDSGSPVQQHGTTYEDPNYNSKAYGNRKDATYNMGDENLGDAQHPNTQSVGGTSGTLGGGIATLEERDRYRAQHGEEPIGGVNENYSRTDDDYYNPSQAPTETGHGMGTKLDPRSGKDVTGSSREAEKLNDEARLGGTGSGAAAAAGGVFAGSHANQSGYGSQGPNDGGNTLTQHQTGAAIGGTDAVDDSYIDIKVVGAKDKAELAAIATAVIKENRGKKGDFTQNEIIVDADKFKQNRGVNFMSRFNESDKAVVEQMEHAANTTHSQVS